MKSFIVVLEGNPGSGKSSLKNDIQLQGMSIERIDQILPNNPDSDSQLVSADIIASDLLKSAQSMKSSKDIVIMDRYLESTLAYQYAHDLKFSTDTLPVLSRAYSLFTDLQYVVRPNLTIYIDVPAHLSVSRKDRHDIETLWTDHQFLNDMRSYYTSSSKLDYVVDGTLSYNEVYSQICDIILKGMKQYGDN